MFLEAIMLTNPPIDRSLWSLLSLLWVILLRCFLSKPERLRDFGGETSSHLDIYVRKRLAYMN